MNQNKKQRKLQRKRQRQAKRQVKLKKLQSKEATITLRTKALEAVLGYESPMTRYIAREKDVDDVS